MIIKTAEQMETLGQKIGQNIRGGEIIELIGDLGAGKTTFTRGLAKGLGITDPITSPSFTINCNYSGRDGLTLHHYDFYRLNDAGVIAMELAESINNPKGATVIEWGDVIRDILPAKQHATITIAYLPSEGREVDIDLPSDMSYLLN